MSAGFTMVRFLTKAMWSGELSDKCATVIHVWNKELHVNVRLNQTMILTILQNIQWCTIDVERFAGLNVCGFNATEVFAEIVLHCLGQKCKERHLHSWKIFAVLLKTVKTAKIYPSESFPVYGSFKIPRVKFLNIGPLFVGMMRLVTGISEGKERLYIT